MSGKSKTNENPKGFIEKLEKIEKKMSNMAAVMATKDDIKNMATKDDIKNMATKDDIARLETSIIKNSSRIDVIEQKMSTKDDIARLAASIVKTNDRIDVIEQKMSTKEDVDRIMSAIDSFVNKTNDHERKALTNTHRINELEPKVENHEKRIIALESRS